MRQTNEDSRPQTNHRLAPPPPPHDYCGVVNNKRRTNRRCICSNIESVSRPTTRPLAATRAQVMSQHTYGHKCEAPLQHSTRHPSHINSSSGTPLHNCDNCDRRSDMLSIDHRSSTCVPVTTHSLLTNASLLACLLASQPASQLPTPRHALDG
eukprot:GHVU01067316.1.p1 GENE.GHVU01067316.1~~GHVU01067316.1.p1  ORF type:complete len:153 (-),score=9.79 GHVU01067316.1:204-662(-)